MEQKENLKVVVGAFTIIAIFCLLYTEFYFKYLYYRHINIIFDTAYFNLVEPLKYFSVAIVFASLYANLFMPTRIKKKKGKYKNIAAWSLHSAAYLRGNHDWRKHSNANKYKTCPIFLCFNRCDIRFDDRIKIGC